MSNLKPSNKSSDKDNVPASSNLNPKVSTLVGGRFRRGSLPLIRRIMKMLEAGYYPARIASILGKSKSAVHYHIKKLLESGFIERQESLKRLKPGLYVKKFRGVITLYRITQPGSKFLAGIERCAVGRRLRLHNVYWKYPVLRQPQRSIDWRKVEMTNWTQRIGMELGLTVRKNPGSVEIISGVVEGVNPFELLLRARDEADRLAAHLEVKFDMKLGRSELSRRPHFGVWDPIVSVYAESFQLSTDLAKIDESEGFGEIDWLSPHAADDYLRMPARIRRLEENNAVLLEGQRLFNEGMLKHMKLIEEVRRLVNALEKRIEDERC